MSGKLVFQAFLNRPPCNSSRSPEVLTGEVVAFDALSGKVRWRTVIGPTESSPLPHQGRIDVGDWRGRVYALSQTTGRIVWSFQTGGRVKGAVAALGNRVFVGSTDGKVYAFGATTGDLLWSRSTGGFVYSSPAVWEKLVLVGSYSGSFYAIDAATGDVRWRFSAGGRISGAPTVMAGNVYFATLSRATFAVDGRTGRQVWSFPDGQYSPIVADGDRAYLVGLARVYALTEKR